MSKVLSVVLIGGGNRGVRYTEHMRQHLQLLLWEFLDSYGIDHHNCLETPNLLL